MKKKKSSYKKPAIKSKKIDINEFASNRFMDSLDLLLGVQEVKAQSTSTCGGCLKSDSKIMMADGSEKSIDQVQIGDQVKSLNTKTNTIENADVLNIIIHKDYKQGYLTINKSLKITHDHKVFINNNWTQGNNIKEGDHMLTSNNQRLTVESIHNSTEVCDVIDLQVGNNHNFFAEHILVHNKVCFLPDTRITLADESYKKISEITIGEKILSFNFNELKTSISTVKEIDSHYRSDGYFLINNHLKVTNDHPVYIFRKGWLRVDHIKKGDLLVSSNGTEMVQSLKNINGLYKVFNLILSKKESTYFAENILVRSYGFDSLIQAHSI